MSTNYYLRNKEEYINHKAVMENRSKIIEQMMKQLQEWNATEENLYDIQFRIESVANVGYEEIHIGKRSGGWMPSFERQEGKFTTVRELKKFYHKNQNKYEIVNEYGATLSWDELKEELLDWTGDRENLHDSYKDQDGYIWHRYEFS